MSNYTKTTDFEAKDSLPTGDSGKIIRGAEFETEFDAIATAIATKADTAGPTFTGTLTFDTISDGTISIAAFVDEDDMSSNSATLVPTQQSVKAYVDAVTTELNAQDLDFQADTGGALSIDLDTETMTFTGGTGIDTSGSGNAVTFAIDSTVTTLTGTQTLTNKTLTSPDVNTPDIDGGTIDGTVIGGTTAAAGSFTTVSATGNITVDGTVDGRDVATDGTKLDGIESGATADQTAAEIRTLVDSATDSNVFTDADHTKLDGIEANATADQTAAEIRTLVEAATDSNVFTDADHTKLDGIEAGADVTDTTNVTAAGAVMDSELTNETAVKSLNQGVATTDSPTFAGLTTTADVSFGDNDKAIFGAGSDLQIYHSSTESWIKDTGTGSLYIDTDGTSILLTSANSAKNMISAVKDGAVTLYNDNTARLATTSTGISVTGDISNTSGNLTLDIAGNIILDTDGGEIPLKDGGTEFGNIYKSSNNLVIQSSISDGDLLFKGNDGGSVIEAMRIDMSAGGLVGIGTSSPSSKLHLARTDASGAYAYFGASSDGGARGLQFTSSDSGIFLGAIHTIDATSGSGQLAFATGGNERMRIDSSGNFLVGTSTTAAGNEGMVYFNGSSLRVTRDSDEPLNLDRLTNGGVIAAFKKDGNTVGSVGVTSSELGIGGGDANLLFMPDDNSISPASTSSGGASDGTLDLGRSARRFKDLYLSGNAYIDTAVGIGASPASGINLQVHETGSGQTLMSFTNDTTGSGSGDGLHVGIDSGENAFIYNKENTALYFGTNNTERMRIDSSGNLLVGTTDTTVYNNSADSTADNGFQVNPAGWMAISAYQQTPAFINRTGNDGSLISFTRSGTTVGSVRSISGDILIGTGNTGLRFYDAGTAIQPRNTDGSASDNVIDIGMVNDRFKDLYLSGRAYINDGIKLDSGDGIYFGQDGTAANKLDDYEEGTFTPSWQASTTTVTVNHASYTKVGRMVTVNFYISNISPATSGDVQYITGLPFTNGSGTHYPAGVIAYSDAADVSNLGVIGLGGDSRIYFHYLDGTSGAALTRNNWNSIKSSGLQLIISMTYEAA